MKDKTGKSKRTGKAWIIWGALILIIGLSLLELGQHRVFGWILFGTLSSIWLVIRIVYGHRMNGTIRRLMIPILIITTGVVLFVSRPVERAVPAVRGENGGATDVVHIAQGDVTGVKTADGKVEVYAGIPYAKPPVGDLRFKEPVPADGWEGTLAADHFGPMSMQTRNSTIYSSLAQIIGYHDYRITFEDNYLQPVSEDSLYLNIWKPAGDVSNLPVLVYIHGGVLQTGQPWYEDYSGEGLAREGVIVVNMAYRLGIFGYFADEELAEESPNHTTGNYGMLDQILALEWVRDNIASFGGDPDNVTLSGESAGSACVSALCTSPLAKGLFKRVVGESSTITSPKPTHSFRTMEEALEAGRETKERFHVSNMAELRALPADKIVGELNIHHHMTIDGYALTETPYESYAKGIHNEEAILQGYNLDEAGPFILFDQANLKNYEQKIRDSFDGDYADRILKLYPASTDEEAKRNWNEIYTVVLFTYGHYCWERQALSNGIPTYVYHFTKTNGRLGNWHSGEEVYLYGNIPAGSKLYDESDRKLSRNMVQYFRNFINDGDPNGDGLPYWSPSKGENQVLEFGEEIITKETPYLELYQILDEYYGFR